MGLHILLWIAFAFILSACDGSSLKDLLKGTEKKDTSLTLSQVVISNVDDESSVQISWDASKEAEEVIITAVPVSGGKPIEIVVSESEYKKSDQKYTLKGLQQKTQYDITVKARAGSKESSEIKETVAIPKDTTVPQDRLQSARIIKAEKSIYLVWEEKSIDARSTDISTLKVRVHTLSDKKVQEVTIQDIAVGRKSIGSIGLNLINDLAYRVELVYIDAYKNAVTEIVMKDFVPSQLKEGVISIQPSKSELIGKIGQAIETITIRTVPAQATGVFRASSSLPLGLKLNQITGEITGIPTEVVSKKTFTITYSGNGGYEGTVNTVLDIQIERVFQYTPTTKDELRKIIEAEIQKQGNQADLNMIDTGLITDMSSLLKDLVSFQGDISEWDTSNVTDMSRMFYGVKAFNSDISEWDTSNVTDMSYMFYGFSGEYPVYTGAYKVNVFQGDISNWDTSSVTTMESMFESAPLVLVDLSQWDTSNVTNMSKMFSGANSFNKDISSWDTSKVKTMHKMFYQALNFNKDISQWNTSNVTDMSYMFGGTRYFNQDLSNWDTSNVTDMSYMFSSNKLIYSYHEDLPIFNGDISLWDTGNVKNMNRMFYKAKRFNRDISQWDTSNVLNMDSMFMDASVFNQNIGAWDVGNVEYMGDMFANAKAFNGDISLWDTSNVKDMNYMFEQAKSFDQDISRWDVRKVSTMEGMFYDIPLFNRDLSRWDTRSVENMSAMFHKAKAFNSDISDWDTSDVKDMSYMFGQAESFNQDISDWNTSKVTNMEGLFSNAHVFNQDISDWDVGEVRNMSYMFYDARGFNQDISDWVTDNVEDMSYMFGKATLFQGDISDWVTDNVADMSYMFDNAVVFNEDISGWNTENVVDMSYMFRKARVFNQDISGWNTSNVTDMSYMFDNATAFNQDISNWDANKVYAWKNMFRGTSMSVAIFKNRFTLTSASFSNGDTLPRDSKYLYDNGNVSPQLSWNNTPKGTQSYLIFLDNGKNNIHPFWVRSEPASVRSIVEGAGTTGGSNEYPHYFWGTNNKYPSNYIGHAVHDTMRIQIFAIKEVLDMSTIDKDRSSGGYFNTNHSKIRSFVRHYQSSNLNTFQLYDTTGNIKIFTVLGSSSLQVSVQ